MAGTSLAVGVAAPIAAGVFYGGAVAPAFGAFSRDGRHYLTRRGRCAARDCAGRARRIAGCRSRVVALGGATAWFEAPLHPVTLGSSGRLADRCANFVEFFRTATWAASIAFVACRSGEPAEFARIAEDISGLGRHIGCGGFVPMPDCG